MSEDYTWILRVGSKGEIYLKKAVQEYMGIKPGDNVVALGKKGFLVLAKKTDALDLLDEKLVVRVTPEELESLRKELSEKMIIR